MSADKEVWAWGDRAGLYCGEELVAVAVKHAAAEHTRRIVGCLNACNGVSTEWLEAQEVIAILGEPIALRFKKVEEQRDELADALRMVEANAFVNPDSWLPLVRAALAKATD